MSTTQERTAKQPVFNARDIAALTQRLGQVLTEETKLLKQMKVSKIAALQQEKIYLTNALEMHRKQLEKNPHLKETIPSQDRRHLADVAAVFENMLEENHRRLSIAREVNLTVVRAVKEVVREASMSKVYGSGGLPGAVRTDTLSVTFDQQA